MLEQLKPLGLNPFSISFNGKGCRGGGDARVGCSRLCLLRRYVQGHPRRELQSSR